LNTEYGSIFKLDVRNTLPIWTKVMWEYYEHDDDEDWITSAESESELEQVEKWDGGRCGILSNIFN